MPITKTAKRALRSSKRKQEHNLLIKKELEIALRLAKTKKTREAVTKAMSLADRAAKRNLIHKHKASRLKSTLSTHMPKPAAKKPKKASKKSSQ